MDVSKGSIQIREQLSFKYRLDCDPFKEIIRLTNYKPTNSFTRITMRNVPISSFEKDKFYRSRSGWSDGTSPFKFKGSYVTKESNENIYKYWEKFIRDRYSEFKKLMLEK